MRLLKRTGTVLGASIVLISLAPAYESAPGNQLQSGLQSDLSSPLYVHPQPDLSAFVLAGGRSTRMGTDKAFVMLAGETLLARALRLCRAVSSQVLIVGDRRKFGSFAA